MKHIIFLILLNFTVGSGCTQNKFYVKTNFSEADSLRGSLRPERTCFDVTFYDLNIKIDPEKRYINGYNDIYFSTVENFATIQIDLSQNMKINKIIQDDKELTYERKYNAIFINTLAQKVGDKGKIRIYYEGKPVVAKNPPWDGGFVWRNDNNGNHWFAVACEGIGASVWWPNKDHPTDEPDSMSINIAVPDNLMCVSNGNLRGKKEADKGYISWNWFVSYPINNYNVTVNAGKYFHFSDTYTAGDGSALPLDYYVLSYNIQKAKKHFEQVPKTLSCFENYFGKYPFWNDGYALVETPYLGMEHQSAIAYGNHYKRGYLGRRIPRNMDWDFIIVHESGHEWWGNSITAADMAEMWIHESFTTYMEALFVECDYGYEDALNYLKMQKIYIRNYEPLIGPLGGNWHRKHDSDEYYKGSWVLHTLRNAIDDDELWFDILRSFYDKNAYSVIESGDFFEFVNEKTGKDYSKFFDQYFNYPKLPVLEYSLRKVEDNLELTYKWKADVKGFDMPVKTGKENNYITIYPTDNPQTITLENISKKEFRFATELFLINVKKVTF